MAGEGGRAAAFALQVHAFQCSVGQPWALSGSQLLLRDQMVALHSLRIPPSG